VREGVGSTIFSHARAPSTTSGLLRGIAPSHKFHRAARAAQSFPLRGVTYPKPPTGKAMRARMGGMKFCREGHAAVGEGTPQANGWVRACSPSCRRAGERSSPLRRRTVAVCNRSEESINLLLTPHPPQAVPLPPPGKAMFIPFCFVIERGKA